LFREDLFSGRADDLFLELKFSGVPISGTMISGSTLMPLAVTLMAASIMARACISVISG
jgi:hypothetical protein